MITSVAWVPRGASKIRPARYEIGPEEYSRIKKSAKQESIAASAEDEIAEHSLKDVLQHAVEEQKGNDVDFSDLPPELRMDEYDDEDDNIALGEDVAVEDIDELYEVMDHGDAALALDADSEDEDAADDEIRPGDTLLVVASTEDDCSHLEVHLYAEDGNLYTHHDITLRDFPLCTAWLDCPPFLAEDGGQRGVGSYLAVGSFEPGVELWNLDVLDPLEPTAVLGGPDRQTARKGKGRKSKSPPLHPDSHSAAVMALSWNTAYRHALCSGSADATVKVWDVTTQRCQLTLSHHTDKVQCVQWHPAEPWLLASAAFDRRLCLRDCRLPAHAAPSSALTLGADPESLRWDPLLPFHLYCAQEDGSVTAMDVRRLDSGSPLLSFQAHESCVSALAFSPTVHGLLATASVDQTVRLWDVRTLDPQTGSPRLVMYKTMNVGKLFALDFYRDLVVSSLGTAATATDTASAAASGTAGVDRTRGEAEGFMLACGGDAGMVAIWEVDEAEAVKSYFLGSDRGVGGGWGLDSTGVGVGVPAPPGGAMAVDEPADEEGADVGTSLESKKKKSNKKKKNKKKKSDLASADSNP